MKTRIVADGVVGWRRSSVGITCLLTTKRGRGLGGAWRRTVRLSLVGS